MAVWSRSKRQCDTKMLARLAKYRSMRDFSKQAEPSGAGTPHVPERRFVIPKHAASRLRAVGRKPS